MIFNSSSRLFNLTFKINATQLECVREYKYLGIIFSLNGSFNRAQADLYHRGQKAFFKLTSLFKNVSCSPDKFLYLFDHTVKPVLMYGAEVTGMFNCNRLYKSNNKTIRDMYANSCIEKLNIHMCKYILGVGKRSSNIATYGELGRYPLYIDMVIALIRYWLRLNKESVTDNLLKDALQDNYDMMQTNRNCWLNCVYMILKEFNLLAFFHNPQSMTKRHIFDIKKLLQKQFVKCWSAELNKSDKLRTYRQFKSMFMLEKYLKHVSVDADRRNLSRFRTSSHRLQIEFGRYTVPKTAVSDRLCTQCSLKAVEDEQHCLLICPKYDTQRSLLIDNFLSDNHNITNQSINTKFTWLMSNEDVSLCQSLAKFITLCFSIRG